MEAMVRAKFMDNEWQEFGVPVTAADWYWLIEQIAAAMTMEEFRRSRSRRTGNQSRAPEAHSVEESLRP